MMGWLVVAAGAAATVWAFAAAAYWTLLPGEDEPDHPKRSILRSDR